MKDYSLFYKELNEQQRLVVDTIDGPLLVLAGPGTGKTQILSLRAAAILKAGGLEPGNILIVTYTNSAAREMKERLARIIGPEGYEIEAATFHSFANSIIQESEEARNYVGNKIQMDDLEQIRALEYIIDNTKGIENLRPFRAPYIYLDDIARRIGEFKKDGITPEYFEDYVRNKKQWDSAFEDKHIKRLKALAVIYKLYEALKEGKNKDVFDDRGRYDFDDMIIFAAEALRKEEGLRKNYRKQFRYIMVDEFQDTNGAQLELLFTLLDYKAPNICCVGDDDQSIYRFQGASVGNFKILKERYPGIKTVSLKDNYRSAHELIELSSRVINMIPVKERAAEKLLNPRKKYKDRKIEAREFSTEEEELIYIVKRIKELKAKIAHSDDLTEDERRHPYNNIAMLVRKRVDILKIVDALLQAGIPYATDGKEDISAEVRARQLLDVLELAHIDPGDCGAKDLELYKVLSSDYFEIPLSDILKFISYVNSKNDTRKSRKATLLAEFLSYFGSKTARIKFEKESSISRAAEVIKALLADAAARPVHAILLDFIKDSGLFKYILAEYADKDILRMRELRAITSFVDMVKAADLARPALRLDEFMRELKTRKDHGLPIAGKLVTMTQDGVRILTAHGSKGREFHSVIMPFCLQNKNWPARPKAEKLPVPSDLFKAKMKIEEKAMAKQLYSHDEIRLFYVAITRAKSNLIFTASPSESAIPSSYLSALMPDTAAVSKSKEDREETALANFLEVSDLRDPILGTEAILKDMVRNMSLNPTRVNTYLSCPRRFLYNDVIRLPGPKRKSLIFGNCVHKALEETYDAYKRSGRFPSFQFFREAFETELHFQGADKSIALHCLADDQMRKLKEWFDAASKCPVMPLGLERKLIVTVGENIIFTGKYDKVEWEDEASGLVRIVDYKTGKPDKHLKAIGECGDLASDECDGYLRQLVCYKLLFDKDKRESNGRKAASGCLMFIEPVSADIKKLGYKKGGHVTKVVAISDSMVAEMEAIIKNVWDNIMRLRFDKLKSKDDDKCRACNFEDICWR